MTTKQSGYQKMMAGCPSYPEYVRACENRDAGSECVELPLSNSIAGKLQIIADLRDTNVYDDDGNVIGQREPIISASEAMELLKLADSEEKD